MVEKGDRYEMAGDKYDGVLIEVIDRSSEIVEAKVTFPENVVNQFDNLNADTPPQPYEMPDPALGGEWELTFASDTLAIFEGTVSRQKFENDLLTDSLIKEV